MVIESSADASRLIRHFVVPRY